MKYKLLLFATIFTVVASPNARAQWECVGGPSAVNCFANNGENLFASTWGSGIFRSTDSGATWILIDSGLGDITFDALTTFAGYVFAGSYDYHGVFRSSDNGISWVADTSDIDSNNYIDHLGVSGNTLFMWGDWRGDGPIFRSNDTGRTWVSSSTQGMSFAEARSGGGFGVNGTNLFVGSTGVYLSTDNGETWNDRSNGLDTSVAGVYDEVFASIGTYQFVGWWNGIFRSSDSGDSWEAASNGLIDSLILSLSTSGSNIFAATPVGIYLSSDSGNSWDAITPFGSIPGGFYSVFAADGYLFGGSDGDSIWRRPLSDFANLAVNPIPVAQPSLNSYPNPFPQSTTITLTTSASGAAELSVVNLLGEEVAHLYDGELGAGEHSFTWNASGFSPGTYWCVMRANGLTQELPMVLSK